MSVYLDYNASAPIDERVLDCMIDVYRNHFGNADSRTHVFGEDARNLVEIARKQAAGLLGIQSDRSEEHTSELQSRQYLVCRLLLEKKK